MYISDCCWTVIFQQKLSHLVFRITPLIYGTMDTTFREQHFKYVLIFFLSTEISAILIPCLLIIIYCELLKNLLHVFYSALRSLHFHLSLLLLPDHQWICDHVIRLLRMSRFSEDCQMPAGNC